MSATLTPQIGPLLALASSECRIGFRNRWVAMSAAMLAVLALLLALLGATPGGAVAASPFALAVVGLTTLGVYLIPLLALLLAADAIVGESDRGTLLLLLTYPIGRLPMLIGKFIGHLSLLALVLTIGFGVALAVIGIRAIPTAEDWQAIARFWASSVLFGAAYLAIGYAISAMARDRSAAAALAIAVWLVSVVLYDIALLALLSHDLLVAAFPYLLIANPGDAFRLINLGGFEAIEMASGLTTALADLPVDRFVLWLVLAVWLALPWTVAWLKLRQRES